MCTLSLIKLSILFLSNVVLVSAFQFPTFASSITRKSSNTSEPKSYPLPSKVAVAGATGRTGSLVVKELLNRGVSVVALVRNMEKANEIFSNGDDIDIVKCNLDSESEIETAVEGCDASIWCATGFSDAESSVFDKLKKLFDITFAAQKSIDAVGVPKMALCMNLNNVSSSLLPKMVMLSSAGVTRPSWDEEKKAKLKGAADIPIVRLNPFNILNIKAESETKLRETGVNYCIVRPCGLNDNWPSGSRPIFSQGDVGVGRMNRKDVAKVLVDALAAPEAVGKTFEVVGLAGYPAPVSIRNMLKNLHSDKELQSSEIYGEDELLATYKIMQQLLPGEKQDAAALAMGQTYEQLDKNEEGKFGARGKEDIINDVPIKVTS